jgi:hypothetical protein
MKLVLALLILALNCQAQDKSEKGSAQKWKLDKNHLLTGGLVFIGGTCKGLNETLLFHYKVFQRTFPNAQPSWFDPKESWTNKYKHRNPDEGPKFPLSTTLLAFTTDQYHLNNFIGRSAYFTALIIKIGEGKKPFRYYLFDLLYYAACYQLGFTSTYYPFSCWAKNK